MKAKLPWLAHFTTAGLMFVSVGSRLGRWHRLLELVSSFQLQLFVGAILLAVVFACLRKWRHLAVVLGCACLSGAACAVGWQSVEADRQTPGKRWRLLQFNVDWENEPQGRYPRLVKLLQDVNADVVVMQEVTESLEPGTRDVHSIYPYRYIEPTGGSGGTAVFSRWPLVTTEIADVGNFASTSVRVDVMIHNIPVAILTAHAPTPFGQNFNKRNEQLRRMGEYAAQMPAPKIVAGDFNATMWSPYFQAMRQTAHLRDVRAGHGLLPTWPTRYPSRLLRIPIDHCLLSHDLIVTNVQIGTDVGSDHFPLIVDLAFTAARQYAFGQLRSCCIPRDPYHSW